MELRYPSSMICRWGGRSAIADEALRITGKADPDYVIVTGRSSHYRSVITEITGHIGAPVAVSRGSQPEPVIDDVDDLTAVLRAANPELLIAVGGGSVIDVAKAAAAIAPVAGDTADYFYGRAKIEKPGIPFIALPTTAGTGAEITKNSVLTDPETNIKQSIRHPHMIPAAAICDAELTVTMPADVTTASGLDALTQAVESYITRKANNASKSLAAESTRLILSSLAMACEDGADREARSAMMEGSMLSAMSFSQVGLGAVHGLAHPIGALLKIPHGYACAVMLPHVLRFNLPACEDALTDLAVVVGEEDGPSLVDRIAQMTKDLGIPAGFSGNGLCAEHYDFILKNCRSNSMRGNPRDVSDDDVLALLEALSQ